MAKSYMPYARRYPSYYTSSSSNRYSGSTTSGYYGAGSPYSPSSTYVDTYMRRATPPTSISKTYATPGSTKLSSRTLQRTSSPRVLPPSPLDRHTTSYVPDHYQPRRTSATRPDSRVTTRQPMKCDHSTQMTKAYTPSTPPLYGTGTSRLSRKDRALSYSELNKITTDLRSATISDTPDVSLRASKQYSSSYDVTSSSSDTSSADRARPSQNGVGSHIYDDHNDSLPDIQAPRSWRTSSMDRYGSANANGVIGSKAGLDGGSRNPPGSSTYASEVSRVE